MKLAISLLVLVLSPLPALAQLSTSYAASYGIDGNPCTREQPCRTFANAITRTNPSGQIIALDSAEYGTVRIGKSISISSAPGARATMSQPPSNDAVISVDDRAGAGAFRIALRGITINAAASRQSSGIAWTYYTGVAAGWSYLLVEDCIISGFEYWGMLVGGMIHMQLNNVEFFGNRQAITMQDGVQAAIANSKFFNNYWGSLEAISWNSNRYTTSAVIKSSTVQGSLSDPNSSAFSTTQRGAAVLVRVADSIITGNNSVWMNVEGSGRVESAGNNIVMYNGRENFAATVPLR